MNVRLIAQVASNDAAQAALRVLEARGVKAGVDGGSLVVTITTEEGLTPNLRTFHAATLAEVESLVAWAKEAKIELVVGVHRAASYGCPTAKYGPESPVLTNAVLLAAKRNGQIALLQSMISQLVIDIGGRLTTDWVSNPHILGDEVANFKSRQERLKDEQKLALKEKDRRIAELEAQLGAAGERAKKLAHDRNRATRSLRKVRRVIG